MTREAWAVLPAGGTGERFAAGQNKLTCLLQGIPVLVRTVSAMMAASKIRGVVVVAHPKHQEIYRELISTQTTLEKPMLWTEGGPTRRESVYRGLLALPPSATIASIHDAARPLISPDLIDKAITAIEEGASGVVVSLPIRDTVKQVNTDLVVSKTLDRSILWRAQTPQVFETQIILQAHQAVPLETLVTDDAQLLEISGVASVQVLEGDERNLKITTTTDLMIAEAFLASPP